MADESEAPERDTLFEIEPDWKEAWRGMPRYDQEDLKPWQTVMVHFQTPRDREDFAKIIGQRLHEKTQYLWHPQAKIQRVADQRYVSTAPHNPRYPVYVPTKGRWESALTIKALEELRIPYFAVVQPQEQDHYRSVVKTGKFLLLPQGLDGLVPARNWILDHATAAGHTRHWQIDDNIRYFYRFHDNQKIRVGDGTIFRCMEDFVDRYENIAIAGPNYEMFAPRRSGEVPPFVLNTRVYSCSLVSCTMGERYRDVYNDDTDICLRYLKRGLCIVQFNAFLAKKMATMRVKGGNTDIYLGADAVVTEWIAHVVACKVCELDESPASCSDGRTILSKDGRWRMADSLHRQHPDVTTVTRKWDRWQHQVDYRRFQDNALVLKSDVIIAADQNDYGMHIIDSVVDTPKKPVRSVPMIATEQTSAAPSALDFAFRSALPSAPPPGVGKSTPGPESTPTADPGADQAAPSALRAALLAANHRLLRRDGKLFVTHASTLTDDERAQIKEHKPALIQMAEEWIDRGASREAGEKPDILPGSSDPNSREALDVELGVKEAALVPPLSDTPVAVQAPEQPERDEIGSQLIDENVPSRVGSSPAPAPVDDGMAGVSRPSVHDAERIPSSASLFEEAPQVSLAQFLGSRVPDRDYTPDEPPDLTGIDTLAIDTETTGLNWAHGDRPIGISIRLPDGRSMYLPWGHASGNLSEEIVKEWARRELRGKHLIGQNVKFDVHHLREWGIDLEAQGCTVQDVSHGAALLDDHRTTFKLDTLAKDFLNEQKSGQDLDKTRMASYSAGEVAEYAKHDAELTWQLAEVVRPKLIAEDLMRVQSLENDVIYPLCEMERNAVQIDTELLDRWCAETEKLHSEMLWEIAREVGFSMSPDSGKDWERLFAHLGLPVTQYTESGAASFTEAILKTVDHRLVQLARQAGKIASLRSKFLIAYRNVIGDDRMLRYSLHQLRTGEGGTISGRLSSSGVNVQQVPNPKKQDTEFIIRRLFVPQNGQMFSCDANQIEFRFMAHYSGSARIISAYAKDRNTDFHQVVTDMVKQIKPDATRDFIKGVSFARVYGASKKKIAMMLELPLDESNKFVDAYDRMFPEVQRLLQQAGKLAETRGYVKTLLGRRARFDGKTMLHSAFNRVGQGGAADYGKRVMVEVHRNRKFLEIVPRFPVHDSIVGDLLNLDKRAALQELLDTQYMPELKVPITWTLGVGENWEACK